ncbi:MAG: diaminopimelate decarboxylase [Vicinamibacterales bacterium]|nr:diaminopimelate decarboxylase [Vicinamibacterales bacterium]
MTHTSSPATPDGLAIGGVSLSAIAREAGTPAYVYDAQAIRDAYARLDAAFGTAPHAIHYALKANSALAIVGLLRSLGSRVDANSMGEVDVALRCGFTPGDIVFTGVGKRRDELERAVGLGLAAINVESPGELDRLDRIAQARGTRARVALRVNPDIDARSHPHISTGLRDNKFGVPIDLARDLFLEMRDRAGLLPVGVHVHIGSQITSLDPLGRAADAVSALARTLVAEGVPLKHLDFGGGLGIAYDGGPPPDLDAYVARIVAAAGTTGLTLVVEPGRLLVGPAGVLLARVVDVKQWPGTRRFVVLDAGMTELMRPMLYDAYHRIDPVQPRPGDPIPSDIVGPICESTDTFARDRPLAPVEIDDLVVIRDAGAYGAVMGSMYLRRPLPPEVLVDQGTWRVIRRRQTIDDMLALEM